MRMGLLGAWALLLASCAGDTREKTAFASVLLEPVDDALRAEVRVEIALVREGERTTATFKAENCPEGAHVVHVHQGTRCGAGASAAGPKWMPSGPVQKHEGSEVHDDSSLGKIYCKADGSSNYIFATDAWELGDGTDFDPTGRAVVLYGDDAQTRIACGVIELRK